MTFQKSIDISINFYKVFVLNKLFSVQKIDSTKTIAHSVDEYAALDALYIPHNTYDLDNRS